LLLKEIIQEKSKEGKTIIFSTHQMEQVERLCSNISLINKGKIVLDGKLKAVKESRKTKAIEVVFNGRLDKEKIKTFLENIVIKENFISGNVKKDVRVFLNWINEVVQVESFQIKIPTLEQIFIDEIRKSS
jgi:ABC-2 type transport system ATP-binding protein